MLIHDSNMRFLILRFMLALVLTFASAILHAAPAPVYVLSVDGAIGPGTADYIVRGLEKARKANAQLAVLNIDTPGGLDRSMRTIIKAILASSVPVATFVHPSGARAASAGTYILYASHIAAMAPGTNLGAATPVQLGAPGTPAPASPSPKEAEKPRPDADRSSQAMTNKQVNDAVAYIRGLAQLRGRNAEWAEQAVRKAVSLPANEALQSRVIDYVVPDVPRLLMQVDGKTVKVNGELKTLQTANAPVVNYEADWRARFLAAITDPSLALLLMTIGVYGLILEFSNPGIGVAGVLGGICLLIALYALQLLPVNYAGLALIVLGLAFMVAEAFVSSFGVLGLGGVIAFAIGAAILIDTEVPGFGIPLGLIVGIAIASALLIAATVGMAIKSRRLAVVTGESRLIGSIAEMLEDTDAQGWAILHGETWRVVGTSPMQRGQKVKIVGRNGLVLEVVPVTDLE